MLRMREPMPRVVVIGSSNTDMTVRLPSLPAPGQTLLGDAFATSPGGKGANQAVAARRAGAEVVFVTAVGDDALGQASIERYSREGISVDHVRVVAGVPSGVALIFVSKDGENMIGVAPGANQKLSPEDIDQLPASVFHDGDVLLVGLEIPIPTAIRAMARGRAAGMTVVLNPAPAPSLPQGDVRELLSAADVLTPNRVEALVLSGMNGSASSDISRCSRRLLELGPRAVVITLGSEGCLVDSGGEIHRIGAPRVEAVDTVGAGDAFSGALATALAEHIPLARAAVWASAAAALAVTKPGAQSALPYRAEIDSLAQAESVEFLPA
jgi:ribokinase